MPAHDATAILTSVRQVFLGTLTLSFGIALALGAEPLPAWLGLDSIHHGDRQEGSHPPGRRPGRATATAPSVPLTLGFVGCGLAALPIVTITERGRLFQPSSPAPHA